MTVIRHLYGRPLDTLLATWGVSLILQQLARSIFGASNVAVTSPIWLNGALRLSQDVNLPLKRLFIIPLVTICPIALHFSMAPPPNRRPIAPASKARVKPS